MRTKIGIVLMLLSIPYAIWGFTHGNGPSVSMGILALIVAGGLMVARGMNGVRTPRRPDLVALPKPSAPDSLQRPEVTPASDTPPPAVSEPSPAPAPQETASDDRRATMLPPPPPPHTAGKPRLRLVHTDGIRMTPEQLRRKVK